MGGGGGVFLTAIVGPTVFSKGLSEVITRQQAGAVAQAILARYFVLQGVLAAIVFLGSFRARDWGWKRPAVALPLSAMLLALVLGSGLMLQPRMREWNEIRYSPTRTPSEQEEARVRFGRWHGIAQVGNLLILTGAILIGCQQAWRLGRGGPAPQ